MAALMGRFRHDRKRKGKDAHDAPQSTPHLSKSESLARAGVASRNAPSPSPSVLPRSELTGNRPNSRASSVRSNATLTQARRQRRLEAKKLEEQDSSDDSSSIVPAPKKTLDPGQEDKLVTDSEDDGFFDADDGELLTSDAAKSDRQDEADAVATLEAQMEELKMHDREMEAKLALTMPGTIAVPSSDLDYATGTDTEYETETDYELYDASEGDDGLDPDSTRFSPKEGRSQSPDTLRLASDHASDRASTPTRPPRRSPRDSSSRSRSTRTKHDPLALDAGFHPDSSPTNYRFGVRPKNPFRKVSAPAIPTQQRDVHSGPTDILFDFEAVDEDTISGGLVKLQHVEGPESSPDSAFTMPGGEPKTTISPQIGVLRRVAPPTVTEELLQEEEQSRASLRTLDAPYPGLGLGLSNTQLEEAAPGSSKRASKEEDLDAAILGSSMLGRPTSSSKEGGLLNSLQMLGRAATQASIRPGANRLSSGTSSSNTVIPKPYIPQYTEPISPAPLLHKAAAVRPVMRENISRTEMSTTLNYMSREGNAFPSRTDTLPSTTSSSSIFEQNPWTTTLGDKSSEQSSSRFSRPLEKSRGSPLQSLPSVSEEPMKRHTFKRPREHDVLLSPIKTVSSEAVPLADSATSIMSISSTRTGDTIPGAGTGILADRQDKQVFPYTRTRPNNNAENGSISIQHDRSNQAGPRGGSSLLTAIMRFTDKLSGIDPDLNAYDQPIFVRHVPIDPYTATPGERRAGIQRPHEINSMSMPFARDSDPAKKYMTGATSSVKRGDPAGLVSPPPIPPASQSNKHDVYSKY